MLQWLYPLLFGGLLHLLDPGGSARHSPDLTTGSSKQNMCVYLAVCVCVSKERDNPTVKHKHRHSS